ncbi:MAG: exopolysaccharide biosynthesis polyprenyl glycosylphosphotransferase [Solobacterium sp.]|nr:exopolysaccharide biosynthesis polyprenyl glycosylphosphotransferase [Solobacterium sp.]
MQRRNDQTKRNILLHTVKILNALLIALPFAYVWFAFYRRDIISPFLGRGNYVVILLYILMYYICGKTYDAFTISYNKVHVMVYSQMLAAIVSDGVLYMVIWLLIKRHYPALGPVLLCIAGQLLMSICWSYGSQKWYYNTFRARKTAIIWDEQTGWEDLISQYNLDKKFEISKRINIKDCIRDMSLLSDAEAVFLTDIHSHDRNTVIKYCVENGIPAFIVPRIGDVLMSGAKRIQMFHLPILRLDRYNPSPEYLIIKRVFDFCASLLALIILSPLMIVTALIIKKDGGPAFYKQCRLTKDGKEFDVLKFRSMRVDAEKDGVARLSTGEKDDRITPVGKVIRKYRIDELPQLINILKGDMSIVGPRPERPEIAAKYEQTLPEFRLRLQAKCGLTGYAQVYGKYNTTPYEKLKMDLMYLSNPSLIQDLSIIFATIKIIFIPESTEGVAEGAVTAMDQSLAGQNQKDDRNSTE